VGRVNRTEDIGRFKKNIGREKKNRSRKKGEKGKESLTGKISINWGSRGVLSIWDEFFWKGKKVQRKYS